VTGEEEKKEPEFANLLMSPGIDSQHGEIDSLEPILSSLNVNKFGLWTGTAVGNKHWRAPLETDSMGYFLGGGGRGDTSRPKFTEGWRYLEFSKQTVHKHIRF
jgi:hypothetical protein